MRHIISSLHPSLPTQISELHQQFAANQPFRHIVLDSFLADAFCQELIAEFPPFDQKRSLNEIGEPGRKAVVSRLASLGPAYQRFDSLMRDGEFLGFIGHITGIPDLFYDPEYVGGGTHENLEGQELDPHVDFNYHPTSHLHRRLNLIIFLNPEWEVTWGGCLELLADPFSGEDSARKLIVPKANRAVIFETTEASWHGFSRIRLPTGKSISRRSIAVYFYTKQRPPQEVAPAHATIYYPRPLGGHIQTGYTLRETDVQEIEGLLARRDGLIRLLYQRELRFSEALHSPSFRLGRALTWPARALRSLGRKIA